VAVSFVVRSLVNFDHFAGSVFQAKLLIQKVLCQEMRMIAGSSLKGKDLAKNS